jgi:tyrosinase
MFFPWHRYFVQYFEDALVQKCGYNGTTPYWDWTIGNVTARLGVIHHPSWLSSFHIDAHDIYNSPFFDNSSSGLGGWGDPNNDYQIYTGGFKDEIRAYPSPHHVRRNFSLYPFSNPDLHPPFAGDPAAPPAPVGFMINTTMTKQNVDHVVNNFEGDFFGFHTYAESTAVSLTFHSLFFGHPDLSA